MTERAERAHRTRDRKRDAHEKIRLGGLIVKAGLRNEDPAVILGLLDEASRSLEDQQTRVRYRRRGKAIFDDNAETAHHRLGGDGSDDDGVCDPGG